ncbi:MAG TPA: hypothetical protein VLE53_12175 [Gemmatimonadaceae bacterium]|nr:hypothetical protein [Gemmatimonadaceae bacterium]
MTFGQWRAAPAQAAPGGPRATHRARRALASGVMLALMPVAGPAQERFDRTRDRGPGVPSSMFGTYVDAGELVVYPFLEYYRDADAEYSPDEFGFGLDQDFRGRYRANEVLLFLGYGVSRRLALELEVAAISATLERSPHDPTAMPASLSESGLGDVEGQVRWRWNEESERSPELFSYFETVFPLQKQRQLIGTSDWEFKLGSGVVRGFRWGTVTVRAAVEYDGEERMMALGEFALEYLRRLSPAFRVFGAVEGSEDEIEGIAELQWALRPNIVLKLNNAIGLTSKATDWAPEVGIMFSLR